MWTTGELAGKYIMDRNIGALDTDYAWTSNGGKGALYYQFGRKDPFPAGTNTAGTASGTVSAAWDSSGSGIVSPAGNTFRAHGQSVRAVQE